MAWDYVIEAIGIIGAIEVLIAYGLNSYQKLRSDSIVFYLLNLTGGILLVMYSIYKEAWASMFINVVWVVIALIGLAKLYQRAMKQSKS